MIDSKAKQIRIGSGITERSRMSIGLTGPFRVKGPGYLPSLLSEIEEKAWEILTPLVEIPPEVDDGGLWDYVIRDAFPTLARKILRGKTGHRPYEHSEWYAAEILLTAGNVRSLLHAGKATEAAAEGIRLGALAEEWRAKGAYEVPVLAHRRSREGAKKGGSRPKRDTALIAFVRMCIRREPNLSAADLWKKIPEDDFEGVKIGHAKLHREFNRLVITRKVGKNWVRTGDVSFRSLRDLVRNIVKKSNGGRSR
ncbi:MAG: hypothetical protein Kow00128_10620 [Deltaproteobacteria bacterium]